MLRSRKYNFIFIHIYKNAGTSITSALEPFSDNWFNKRFGKFLRLVNISYFSSQPYPDHITASMLADKMGRQRFSSYFSFAIVRNPWDWQVSLYNYMLKNVAHHQHELVKSFKSFDDYIDWRCNEEIRYQRDFIYSDNGEKLIDYVGRYERLEKDFQTICEKIGVAAQLPKLNISRSVPYQNFYNEETIEMVRQAFYPDIKLFDYDYE